MKIKGKSFFITGGSSGLGEATVIVLLELEANVVIIDIQPPKISKDFAEKQSQILYVKADVTSTQEVRKAIEYGVAKFGLTFGGVINCSGIFIPGKTVEDGTAMDLEQVKNVVNVNLIGTINVASQVAALLIKQDPEEDGERGAIINVSSVTYIEGNSGQVAYCASKGGIAGITLPMARDLSIYGIRVLAIAPGCFVTPILKIMPDQALVKITDMIEFPQRFGKPSEFAKLVIYLIENTYMNGEIVRIDGGLRLGKL
ncbi:hypothetical protein G9A89_011469 [Geosiphon pyriformis]|nr:hypothetical protein G9A89_011469 [Geosiphon pyriformis]